MKLHWNNLSHARFERNELNCNCVQRCNETYYSVQYSSAKWPSEKYEGYLFAALDDSPEIRSTLESGIEATLDNILRLSFTFEELNKQEIAEDPKYSVEGLLGQIGGTLGLCVGVSFITIAEFIDYFLDLGIITFFWLKTVFKKRVVTPIKRTRNP